MSQLTHFHSSLLSLIKFTWAAVQQWHRSTMIFSVNWVHWWLHSLEISVMQPTPTTLHHDFTLSWLKSCAASPATSPGRMFSLETSSSSLLLGSSLTVSMCFLTGCFSRARELNSSLLLGFISNWRIWCHGGLELCMCCFDTEGVISFNNLCLRLVRTLHNLKVLECKEGFWLVK